MASPPIATPMPDRAAPRGPIAQAVRGVHPPLPQHHACGALHTSGCSGPGKSPSFLGSAGWHDPCSSGGQEVRMVPMIDTMITPGAMDSILAVGPAFALMAVAVVSGMIWFARGTAEELRRLAARDWER